jgi:hypothetical protein
LENNVRPPCKKTSTGFLARVLFGCFVQILSFKQSSEAEWLFCAAKFFHTRKPDGCVKFGKLFRSDLFDGQSADYDGQWFSD